MARQWIYDRMSQEYDSTIKLLGFDNKNPKSLNSITALRAGQLVLQKHCEAVSLYELEIIFAGKKHIRKYRKKYDWLLSLLNRKLKSIDLLLESYSDLIIVKEEENG